MSDNAYFYATQIQWAGKRRGDLHAAGLPPFTVSTPPEFKGEAGFWTPEHLFVAAAESCLMATFLGIAENSALPIVSYRSSACGRLEKIEGAGLRFTAITIYPIVHLENAQHRARAERIMAKAEKSCLIANSIALPLRVEPNFVAPAAELAAHAPAA